VVQVLVRAVYTLPVGRRLPVLRRLLEEIALERRQTPPAL
jgi:hypothetical protein